MKQTLFILALFFIAPALVNGQTPLYTAGLTYTAGAPTHDPGRTGSKYAIDTVSWNLYVRSVGNTWSLVGDWLQSIAGCSAPAYTPTKYQSVFVVNACSPPELYYYTGATWEQIGGGSGGITGTGLAGRVGVWLDATTLAYDVNFVYDTLNNELGVRTANPTRTLDVNGEARVRDLNTTTPTILVGADTAGVFSAVTVGSGLSLAGGTLSSTATGTDLSFSGASSPVTLNSSTGTDVTITAGTGISLSATSGNVTITNSNPTDDITGSGLANRLAYWTAAGAVGFESTLRVDTVNNRLRIGSQTAPDRTLDITGMLRVSDLTTANNIAGLLGHEADGDIGTAGTGANTRVTYWTGVASVTGSANFTFNGNEVALATGYIANNGGSQTSAQRFQTVTFTGGGFGHYILTRHNSGTGTSNAFEFWTSSGNATTSLANANSAFTIENGRIGVNTGKNTNPSAGVHVISKGTTSATTSARFSTSLDSAILVARDDRRVGINTTTPDVSVDFGDNTDAVKLPSGTTAQRPSVNNTFRINTDVEGPEYRENGVWYRLGSSQAPTVAAGAAAGTAPTITVTGSDLAGRVTLTAGTTPTTGALFTVTYGDAFDASSNFYVTFSCRDADCTGLQLFVSAESSTSFTISTNNAPTNGVEYIITYHVGQ